MFVELWKHIVSKTYANFFSALKFIRNTTGYKNETNNNGGRLLKTMRKFTHTFPFQKKSNFVESEALISKSYIFYILFLYFSSSFTLFLRFVVHVIASYHCKIAIVKLWNIVEIMHFNIVKKKAPTSSLSDISRKEFLNVLYLEIHRSDMLSKVRLLFRDFWRHIWQFGRIYTREHMHECSYIDMHTSTNKFHPSKM